MYPHTLFFCFLHKNLISTKSVILFCSLLCSTAVHIALDKYLLKVLSAFLLNELKNFN